MDIIYDPGELNFSWEKRALSLRKAATRKQLFFQKKPVYRIKEENRCITNKEKRKKGR